MRKIALAFGRIKEFLEKGIIDRRLAEWPAELQQARNLSAHASGEKTSREDAEDLLQFVNAVFEYVFVLTRRFERFMERKREATGVKSLTQSSCKKIGPHGILQQVSEG